MKTGITIILFVLLSNSLLYYAYFSVSLMHAKIEAHLAISDPESKSEPPIIKIPVCKLDKDENDEVWYQNKLYDVIKRDLINDTIYVSLLSDNNEEQLLTANYNYFCNDDCIFSVGSFKIPHSKKIISLPDCQYLLTTLHKMNCYNFTFIIPACYNEYYRRRIHSEVPTPPPKLLIAIKAC